MKLVTELPSAHQFAVLGDLQSSEHHNNQDL